MQYFPEKFFLTRKEYSWKINPLTTRLIQLGGIDKTDGHRTTRNACTIWFTGLSCAGKTTLAISTLESLRGLGLRAEMLDGDDVRRHICRDLGFGKLDRDENIRRIAFIAELLARNGVIVLVSAISPYRAIREEVRCRLGNFIEVYVNAPINVCEQRDVKGLYRRFRAGEIRGVAGIDEPYEPPISPKVECRTDRESIAESVNKVFTAIDRRVFQISEQLAVPVMPKKSDEPQRST